jgi:hypothetical protein
MFISRHQNAEQNNGVRKGKEPFENVHSSYAWKDSNKSKYDLGN